MIHQRTHRNNERERSRISPDKSVRTRRTSRRTVSLQQAKARLPELFDQMAAGDEVVITKAGVPRFRLVALPRTTPLQPPGAWKGKLWISDDFDAPLPPEVLASFYGG